MIAIRQISAVFCLAWCNLLMIAIRQISAVFCLVWCNLLMTAIVFRKINTYKVFCVWACWVVQYTDDSNVLRKIIAKCYVCVMQSTASNNVLHYQCKLMFCVCVICCICYLLLIIIILHTRISAKCCGFFWCVAFAIYSN